LEDLYWFARASIALSGEANNRLGELPPSRERYEALAASEEERGRYPEAARAWKQSLQFEPSDTGIQRHLALALCHANDCVSALPMLKEQLIHEPDSAELNYLYGLALQSTRDTSNAIAYLEKSVRIDGHFTPAHAALGEAYLEADKPHQAVPHLKIAISEDTNGIRHYQLARAYQALGMRNEAAVALSEYRQISLRQKTLDSPDTSITPP
jgi:predicted Zn-dependent protease